MTDTRHSLPGASGCLKCGFTRTCGGLEGMLDLAGCTTRDHAQCLQKGWTCFCKLRELAYRANEVDGFTTGLRVNLDHTTIELPFYIPTVHHGSSREQPLNEAWVAVPLYSLFRSREGRYRPVAESANELRRHLCLADSVKILALGVDDDQQLEEFWRNHQTERVGEALRQMGVAFVSPPNFSYFLDAPPPHTLYNRSRILRVIERLAGAGLSVGLHLNAYLPTHWEFWKDVLKDQPQSRHVTVEFQTGLKSGDRGSVAYQSLLRLQDELGRPLHPILIAGQKYLRQLPRDFAEFSIVDSAPFMRAMFRRVPRDQEGEITWHRRRTKLNEPVDWLLAEGIRTYRGGLERKRDRWRSPGLPLTGEFSPPRSALPPQASWESLELYASKLAGASPATQVPRTEVLTRLSVASRAPALKVKLTQAGRFVPTVPAAAIPPS